MPNTLFYVLLGLTKKMRGMLYAHLDLMPMSVITMPGTITQKQLKL